MKITIIFDNTLPVTKSLQSDWGFAALIEIGNLRILFDTGANGFILLNNMKILGIEPTSIDEVFISHPHHDHVGGLPRFLEKNREVRIWIPPSFGGTINAKEVIAVPEPTSLHADVYSTGELEGIEQSMAVKASKGLVLIAGCSHPRMETMLETASQFGNVYGIVGGLHATRPEALQGLGLICATHCTQQKAKIRSLYPEAYIEGGAGRVINIP
jgi:7,8-dihydropterin-6-yl-methyl-4-(beta-D-ribofuranosyl)aminobenzene 5'-phosphate synthase